ncbi:MAG: endolytic transglycosylase MltG [Hyphomicrobiales bacterium]
MIIGSAVFTLLLLAMAVVGTGINFLATKLHEPGPLAVGKSVVVRGNSASEISDVLLNERVIDNGLIFWVGVKMLGVDQRLHKGEFQFPAQASIEAVIDILVEGKSIDRPVTIPEGKTSEEVVAILKANEFLAGDIRDIPREGTLLPDTYKFTRGEQRSKVLTWMADAQHTALNDIWKRRSADLPIHTAQELVILASIVEKETGKADERPRVAGVFINRLLKGMRLQSDPTTVYGLVGGKGVLGHALTAAELAKPTPYNTYTIDGLPPGPITNPGRAAMEAVANPSRTKELYFVADGTGGHVFAETLDQHQRNVARWRQIQIEADRAAAAAAAGGAPPAGAPAGQAPGAPIMQSAPQQPTGAAVPSPAAGSPGLVGRPAAAPAAPAPPVKAGQKRGASTPATIGRLPAGATALTEPDPPARGGTVASFPLSPAMRAKMEREAAAAGVKLGPSSTQNPSAIIGPSASPDADTPDASAAPVSAATPASTSRRPLAFDAVAGTAKDPLNNKTFDLNSPKTVPNLK